MPQAPASRAARTTSLEQLGLVRDPRQDRRHPDATPARRPRRARDSARSRCRGGAVPGSVRRQTSSSSVGTENVTETSARCAASTSTSTSRTISGPRVIIVERVRAPRASTSRQARVSRYRPSAGWYGSVAAPIATGSPRHDGRASSRRSTSATLTLTRIDVP